MMVSVPTLAILLLATLTVAYTADIRVATSSGPVLGRVISPDPDSGREHPVREFLGVPYARPPTGELRFRAPEPVEPWRQEYSARELPPACNQEFYHFAHPTTKGLEYYDINANVSEDCLYLNIWAPASMLDDDGPLAVMVWLHWGGFNIGSSTSKVYDGKILVSKMHVIIASVQYRVGALGFLSVGTEEAPGNVGLLDQQLAFKWLRENAANFGGDPERITIFGESGGSGSVSFHLLAPSSRQYFRRAIMQSGTANAPWALQTRAFAKGIAVERARDVGCGMDEDDVNGMVECLRTVSPMEVTAGHKEGEHSSGETLVEFLPVIDGNFISETPSAILENGTFYKTEIMLGTTEDEGSLIIALIAPHLFMTGDGTTVHMNVTSYRKTISQPGVFPHTNKLQQEAIAFRYRNWRQPNSSEQLISGVSQGSGDMWFHCPVLEVAERSVHEKQATYVYQFSYKGSLSLLPKWAGATHGDDLAYVFGLPFIGSLDCSAEERYLSDTMMAYWTNFAETGNPNSGDNRMRRRVKKWPKRTSSGHEYLTLTASPSGMVVGEGPGMERCTLWKHYIPTLQSGTCDSNSGTRDNSLHIPILLFVLTTFSIIWEWNVYQF